MDQIDISVVIPCLNEESTITACVSKALEGISRSGMRGEVVVVDNGSTDSSARRAKEAGARVVTESRKGYGSAYLRGIAESGGRYLVFGDADDTYDFREIPGMVAPLVAGADMVLGSRFAGTIRKGAMTFSHRYIGNPILTALLNLFFHTRVSDGQTGFRVITREALERLNLKTTGMEFASEMIVSALRVKLRIEEFPIVYYARGGESKLNSIPDAWRHVRFMLLYSPTWLFLVPGALLFFGGFAAMLLSAWGKLVFFHHTFDIHAMVFFVLFCLMGSQIIMLGLYARSFSVREGFVDKDPYLEALGRGINLERGLLAGTVLFLAGFCSSLYLVVKWIRVDLVMFDEVKLSLFTLLFMFLGIQTIFSSFFLSLLKIPRK